MSHLLLHLLLLLILTLSSNGYFITQGSVNFGFNNFFTLTNTTKHTYGQAFDNQQVIFKNSSSNLIITSFSINFFFAIVPQHSNQGSHGMAFVISPSLSLPGASSDQYLGIFNESNNGNSSNHILAIELDIHKDDEFDDIDDNHVGININGMKSIVSSSAGYYDDKDGNFIKLSLISTKVMRISIVYDHIDKQLNVTLCPAEMPIPPLKPLLSLNQDLSDVLLDKMYAGFAASTGSIGAIHYMMGWFVTGEIEYPRLEFGRLPILPPYPKKSDEKARTILSICLTLSMIFALVATGVGLVFYLRHKKVKEVLEEWEIQFGPHRFTYKELFNATKGFKDKQLLGKGGFGQVYKGKLAGSETSIAVKRTSHDSRQGITEFLAELSTIGRLRHPNLVRLLGYCKEKDNLYLVYDFMPNGSLDKYLTRKTHNQEELSLTWKQRFKIIRDIGSALLYLHQEWVKVIIHRDIKPGNILIDHEMNAKLGDFGLAKLYDQGFDPKTSKVAGTFGYIAPEFMRTGRATTRTDVYAFGLVILEIVCGRRLIERRIAENEEILVEWIVELWEKGEILNAAKDCIVEDENRGEIEVVLKLGLLCCHQDLTVRPDMKSVMMILNGELEIPVNLLDVVKEKRSRDWFGRSEEEVEVKSLSSNHLLTNSVLSYGR